MSIEDEMQVYDAAETSNTTGETESYDYAFFSNVIRKRELELIQRVIEVDKPKLILDYGCGGGWLSLFLLKWRYNFVGVDVSKNMVRTAKIVCPAADFIVCDAMKLPFKSDSFSFVIGISILHHLNLRNATNELKRISITQTSFLFMEPNLLNPFSAFGRKVFPMKAHTKGEKPFTPEYLNTSLVLAGFKVERCFSIFCIAFSVARFFKIARLRPSSNMVKTAYFFENVMEKVPAIRYLNSNIVVVGKITRIMPENGRYVEKECM